MNNEWSATRGTSRPKHAVYLSRDTSKATILASVSTRAEESHVALNHPCRDTHSVQFWGKFGMKRNILQWKKIRGYVSESVGTFPLLSGTKIDLESLFFYCFEICWCACKWGVHLRDTFVFQFILREACWSSAPEGTSALNCSSAWACDLVYHAMKSVVYFASLETLSKHVHFCFRVSTRKTPRTTADLWSISFPMRADSPSLTPFQSFSMHRKFCCLPALQRMRFEHCVRLGASKSLSLFCPFRKSPHVETLNSVAPFCYYILRSYNS